MSSIKVRVSQGVVRGCEEKLTDGRSFLRFSGIPYAKSPVGELRFRSPQKLEKFVEKEIDCTKERDACFHKSTMTREMIGSEDCLNLNVYVPKANSLKTFNVMVYIHGGGLKYDSNSRQLYSPEYLLMENVIVVTINYRLHVLGFMSLPSMGISGNTGLKDQQMALEWVHENISNFNGDPNNICLFGESAGATCVHFHVMNKKSRSLIKSAICQSGTAFSSFSFRGNTDRDVRQVAKLLGCESDKIEDVFETLVKAPVKELYLNCEANPSPTERTHRFRRWRFVIEEESEDAFITKSTIDSMIEQQGQIDIPLIIGTNDGDGMPKLAENMKRLKEINDDIERLIPKNFQHLSANDKRLLAAEIKKFYFDDKEVSIESIELLKTVYTDVIYLLFQTICNDFTLQYQPKCKQFLYEFQFDGKLNIQKKLVKLEQLPGACHADDVFYLFGGELADKVHLAEDSREWKMRQLMCRMWANFAKFHDPTPHHDDSINFKWTPVEPPVAYKDSSKINLDYLVINDNPRMIRNLNKNRMDFWRNVYRKWERRPLLLMSKL